MKNCPNCNLELPSEAHFCPKCMYEYPRVARQRKRIKFIKKKKRVRIILVLVVVLLLKDFWPLLRLLIPKSSEKETTRQNQPSIELTFRTNEMSGENPAIIHDFEDVLFTDLDSVSQILGEEIEEACPDGEYMVHEFESVEIEVSQDERVKSIYIDYMNARDEVIEQFGIHGINGKTSREEVRGRIGTPDQNFEEEWSYRFDGERGMPTLRVFFDENDMVTALQYYTLQ